MRVPACLGRRATLSLMTTHSGGRYRQVVRDCTVEDVAGLSPAAAAASSDALRRSAHCRLADGDGADESPGE
jgi:hypothetical protein